jgi:hypothetical protein
MADGLADGLFDLLTQSIFDPGANDLPEVDQLFLRYRCLTILISQRCSLTS